MSHTRRKAARDARTHRGPTQYASFLLWVMNRERYPMFEGIDPVVKAKRRAANKVAKRSRKINRGR
jgi:hypothetical protein